METQKAQPQFPNTPTRAILEILHYGLNKKTLIEWAFELWSEEIKYSP